MKPTPAKLTYEDFLRFPDDGLRHELIDGEHYVTPSPATVHQRLVSRLHGAFFVYFQAHSVGEVFTAPFDVVLSTHDVVEPDLLVILADQAEIVNDANVRGAPAIVIEIASPSTRRRDEGIKKNLYDRAGVREYWMVDPVSRTIAVRAQPEGRSEAIAARLLAADDVLTTPLLPGFALPLSELFR